jgi:hypothetical protein
VKYGNKKVRNEHGAFDSQKEFMRFLELRQMERDGKIHQLDRQVVYELAEGCILYGRRRPPMKYKADFRYLEQGQTIVEDVKGFRTQAYKLKRHLMKSKHGIEIRET